MRHPLRLVFVGTLAEPGGAAQHFVSLTIAMASAGHSIAVVAAPGGPIWRALESRSDIQLYGAEFRTTFDRPATSTLRRVIRDRSADAVITVFERDYWGTAAVAWQSRVPLYLFFHHAGLKRYNKLLLPWLRRHFVAPSQNLRSWLAGLGVPPQRIDILYNPVDVTHFQPNAALRASCREELGVAEHEVLIGFIGRLESNKGVIPFARATLLAMQQVPNLRVLWIGFGRRESDLDACISESPFAVRHLRRPWTEDVLSYHSAMDLLALPSTGREAFGRVLVEAQACEVPVLGSDIGGIPETMDAGKTGLLVAPGDVEAWANAVATLALDAECRHRMGKAGRDFVRERFDSAVVAKAFEQMLLHDTASR